MGGKPRKKPAMRVAEVEDPVVSSFRPQTARVAKAVVVEYIRARGWSGYGAAEHALESNIAGCLLAAFSAGLATEQNMTRLYPSQGTAK